MGIEPGDDSSPNTAILPKGGADSGAVPAADPLAAFVACLTAEQRAALAALVTSPAGG
jgi:hypothetical protein